MSSGWLLIQDIPKGEKNRKGRKECLCRGIGGTDLQVCARRFGKKKGAEGRKRYLCAAGTTSLSPGGGREQKRGGRRREIHGNYASEKVLQLLARRRDLHRPTFPRKRGKGENDSVAKKEKKSVPIGARVGKVITISPLRGSRVKGKN